MKREWIVLVLSAFIVSVFSGCQRSGPSPQLESSPKQVAKQRQPENAPAAGTWEALSDRDKALYSLTDLGRYAGEATAKIENEELVVAIKFGIISFPIPTVNQELMLRGAYLKNLEANLLLRVDPRVLRIKSARIDTTLPPTTPKVYASEVAGHEADKAADGEVVEYPSPGKAAVALEVEVVAGATEKPDGTMIAKLCVRARTIEWYDDNYSWIEIPKAAESAMRSWTRPLPVWDGKRVLIGLADCRAYRVYEWSVAVVDLPPEAQGLFKSLSAWEHGLEGTSVALVLLHGYYVPGREQSHFVSFEAPAPPPEGKKEKPKDSK